MILIADSGASKTDWLFTTEKQNKSFETPGISPIYQDTKEIAAMLESHFSKDLRDLTQKIYFYGSGCIKGKTDKTVEAALAQNFPNAGIFVEDDMLGAARAVLGKQQGIACILGTGANSCLYNGNAIIDKVPALGFILGDEGSGAHIGKLFINDYFKRAIPEDLATIIDSELGLEMTDVITSVYRKEYPSRYLAGFSRFLGKHREHPYVKQLIKRSLREFFIKNIERYKVAKNVSVNFVGSIAYHYRELLQEVAEERDIAIGKIINKPIAGLVEYHTKQ